MASKVRTEAACLTQAIAFPFVAKPVDVTDEEAFPNIAQARREYAALPAERRAQLEAEWDA